MFSVELPSASTLNNTDARDHFLRSLLSTFWTTGNIKSPSCLPATSIFVIQNFRKLSNLKYNYFRNCSRNNLLIILLGFSSYDLNEKINDLIWMDNCYHEVYWTLCVGDNKRDPVLKAVKRCCPFSTFIFFKYIRWWSFASTTHQEID